MIIKVVKKFIPMLLAVCIAFTTIAQDTVYAAGNNGNTGGTSGTIGGNSNSNGPGNNNGSSNNGNNNDNDDADDDDQTDWEEYFAVTSQYEGYLYHIDIVVEGTFEYSYTATADVEVRIVEINKTWEDEEDHSEDEIAVYLLDENGDYILDENGDPVTVTLNADNNWSVSLEDYEYDVY